LGSLVAPAVKTCGKVARWAKHHPVLAEADCAKLWQLVERAQLSNTEKRPIVISLIKIIVGCCSASRTLAEIIVGCLTYYAIESSDPNLGAIADASQTIRLALLWLSQVDLSQDILERLNHVLGYCDDASFITLSEDL
jgi:hypothetical protein